MNMNNINMNSLDSSGGVGGMGNTSNLSSVANNASNAFGLSVNPNQHYEMLKLHHMNLLNEIQETTLMMNLYQQQHLQQQQQLQQQMGGNNNLSRMGLDVSCCFVSCENDGGKGLLSAFSSFSLCLCFPVSRILLMLCSRETWVVVRPK